MPARERTTHTGGGPPDNHATQHDADVIGAASNNRNTSGAVRRADLRDARFDEGGGKAVYISSSWESASAETLRSVFCSSDAAQVRSALHSLGGDLISALGESLPGALEGSDDATRTYVHAYRTLGACLLEQAHERPEIMCGASGAPSVPHNARSISSIMVMVDVLGNGSAEAPFSPWTSYCDIADAVALDCANRVRMLVGTRILDAPAAPISLTDAHGLAVPRFLRRVRYHLNHPDDENPLRRIMEVFKLSKTELGGLFGVSRQAVDGWIDQGVPADRQEKLAAVLALADLLERKLKAGRIPGVARRPADGYGGETMLSMITADRHGELLGSVRGAFDWSQAA